MKTQTLLRIALRSIAKNKMRTLLTILGVVIGVAAVIVMVAVGYGASRSIQTKVNGLGTNMIVVTAGSSAAGGVSQGAGDDWACVLNVNGSGLGQVSVDYTLVVRPNGCYTAEGPPSVVGPLHIRTSKGRSAVNPLYAFDGCMIAP